MPRYSTCSNTDQLRPSHHQQKHRLSQTTYECVVCKFRNILLLHVVHQNINLAFTNHRNSFAVYWLQLSHSPYSSIINDRQEWSNGRTIIPQGTFITCRRGYALLSNQCRLHTARKQPYLIYKNVPRVTQEHTYFKLIRMQCHRGTCTLTNKSAISPTTTLQLTEQLIQNSKLHSQFKRESYEHRNNDVLRYE